MTNTEAVFVMFTGGQFHADHFTVDFGLKGNFLGSCQCFAGTERGSYTVTSTWDYSC